MTVHLPSAAHRHFDSLIHEHLPLARHHALQYRGRGVELEELVQVANLALVKAAHGFDQSAARSPPMPQPPSEATSRSSSATTPGRCGHRGASRSCRLPSPRPRPPTSAVRTSTSWPTTSTSNRRMSSRRCRPAVAFRSESTDRPVGTSGLTIGETLMCRMPISSWSTNGCRSAGSAASSPWRARAAAACGTSKTSPSRRSRTDSASARCRCHAGCARCLDAMRRQASTHDHEEPPEAA